MKCQRCISERVAQVSAKCSDMCYFDAPSEGIDNQSDYAPCDAGFKGGDYVSFSYCLDCGQMQGQFPLPIMNEEEVIWKIQEGLERVCAHEGCRGEQDAIFVESVVNKYGAVLRFYNRDGFELFLDVGSALERLASIKDGAGELDLGEVYAALED